MFLVSGITGKVGGAAARRLLEEGHSVRALVRDPLKASEWSRKGVDVRRGDLNDAAAVAGALEGVEGAYLMLPPVIAPTPDFAEVKAMIASFREALRQAPPPRLVVLSSFGSQQRSDLGLITATHLLEESLDGLPLPTAFVRAGSFLENYAHGLGRVASTGYLDSFMAPTDRSVPMVGTADIGNQVARLLLGGWSGRKFVELGTRYSPDDVARAMSEVLGRPVQARPIPRETWASSLQAMGLAPGTTGAYEEMLDGINSGWIDFGVPGTEPVAATVTPAQVFAQATKARGAV
ncbi:NmrA family NAD(P)-binding protein [Pyxidicoccus sp. MSG2]|uniref:NmrA family NAD(P)-binding protein n=1 Tax=Pyxidicoccus sp. MSG2 TaxID=2996790 RepID=UPI0022711327|nr:NmrA family NAD(P)-binding protein [Pyxidicoccus sp. MSG2]MCY1023268.1 NmrA family NAD(P)-binding protein [Pyxidicoccus sp. MSG2]